MTNSTKDNEGPASLFAKWRADTGWTVREVAALAGISPSLVTLIEHGQRHPSPATRVKISRRLGVPIATLFEPETPRDEGEADA